MTSRRRVRRSALDLPGWAGVLSAVTVLGTVGVVAVVLLLEHRLDGPTGGALAAGAAAGVLTSTLQVAAASRLGAGLRRLHGDALARLQDPSRPLTAVRGRSRAVRCSGEVVDLARVLDALHLRVRVADDLAEQHRLAAATAGAGVAELLSGLVAAEEGARGQLAADLHDTVAQSLAIARGLLAAPPGEVDLVSLSDAVEDAEEQVRAVMARTRPPALRDGDLAVAVETLRNDLRARYGLEVHVEWPPVAVPLPLPAAVTLYRFCQEALLNVVKHADVDEAWLALRLTADEVVAVVRDEGPGFDPDQVPHDGGRHVGLDLLRERARLSGGRVEVSSDETGTGPAGSPRAGRGHPSSGATEPRDGTGTVLRLHLPRARPPSAPVPAQRTGSQVVVAVEPVPGPPA